MCFKRCFPPSVPPRGRYISRTALVAAAAAFLALGLAACGKKGDPLPPLRTVPAAASDLSVLQQGRLLQLELSYPATTINGLPLGGIDSLELLQMLKPSAEGDVPTMQKVEFSAGGEELLTLRGTELEAAIAGSRIQIRLPLSEELPEEPAVHYYGVRTVKADETSEISNVVGLVPVAPPAPPQNLRAAAEIDAIKISWESDAEVTGFEVFRREAVDRAFGAPMKSLPGSQQTFRDTNVSYGKRYIYTVRAIVSTEPRILSDPAGEREIDYEDRFAPPLPQRFTILGERARVRLRWDASQADDVAGYVLYRREPRRSEFSRINEDLIKGVEHIDRGLASGLEFEYRIQAVDRSGNESELSEPQSVRVR